VDGHVRDSESVAPNRIGLNLDKRPKLKLSALLYFCHRSRHQARVQGCRTSSNKQTNKQTASRSPFIRCHLGMDCSCRASARCPAAPGVVVRLQRAESIFAGAQPKDGGCAHWAGQRTMLRHLGGWGHAWHDTSSTRLLLSFLLLSSGLPPSWHGDLPHHTSLIYGLQSTQPRSSSIYKPPTVHSRQLQARFRPVELVGRGKRTARRLRALLGDALMMVMRRTPARAAGWPAAGSSSVCTRALNFLSQLAARHVRFRILQWSIYWTVQLELLATAFTSDELVLTVA
jgi:hypothetical protein